MMRSIQSRLNAAFIGLILVLLSVIWVIQSQTLRDITYEFVGSRMKSDSLTVLKALEKKDEEWVVNQSYISAIFSNPMSGHYYQYLIDDGQWRYSRSLWDEEIPTYDGLAIGESSIELQMKNDQPWLVYDHIFEKSGHKIRIVLAEDVSHIEEELDRLSWWLAGVGAKFIVALLIAQIIIIRIGLKSLTRVRKNIVKLKEGEICSLPVEKTQEVAPLVDEINYLIESMTLRLERSRHAVGNLAHAAKTPLTVIDRHIETLKLTNPECAQALSQQSLVLRELLQRELTRARIAGAALPGQKVIIEDELAKLVKTMNMIHQDKALAFEVSIKSTTFFPGERDDLIELLGNLIDNASKWAASKVRIRGMMDEHCLEMCIEDDGPGIPANKVKEIMSRGVRLDESTTGHGLGLSIVTEIVRQYKGQIELIPSELGGLHVHLLLPRQKDSVLAPVNA